MKTLANTMWEFLVNANINHALHYFRRKKANIFAAVTVRHMVENYQN